ncbi:AAA domain protein [Paraburkholderia xenovorans LB400]|uniref:Uncharacterized protein n=1 Tax=Paraburkholderia xenovorans (strain LB400) TaxID=266265 RepID=Q144A4_PARXL|nr:AAA family ATPase [Paraburkholderia xenovorans]ABE29335.1 hypothetical protein Bxe_A3653 [Paraburkholderia xenovorans LB400]AIP30194.1 AAA domain protein [Paraburkholderia xenovorans LB400]
MSPPFIDSDEYERASVRDHFAKNGDERARQRRAERPAAGPHAPAPYATESLAELATQSPPQHWIVKPIASASSLLALFGAAGCGKSFLGFDLGVAVAGAADEWFHYRVSHVPVLLVVLEGDAGIPKRARAWHLDTGSDYPARFWVLRGQPFDLRSLSDIDRLIEVARRLGMAGGLVIVDTLNRASGGADENSSADVGRLIEACKVIQLALSATVILIAHSGKDSSRGLRGHSSLYAALDAAIEVRECDGGVREWTLVKSKDGCDGLRHTFRLRSVEVGVDDDGDPVTSCVIEPLDAEPERLRPARPRGSAQMIVYRVVGDMLRASREFGKANAPPTHACVPVEAAIEQAALHMVCKAKNRRYVARRTVTHMIASRIYSARDDWLWAE